MMTSSIAAGHLRSNQNYPRSCGRDPRNPQAAISPGVRSRRCPKEGSRSCKGEPPTSAQVGPGLKRVPDRAEGEARGQAAAEAQQAKLPADRQLAGVQGQRERNRSAGGVAEPALGGEHLTAESALAPHLYDR